MVNVHARVSVNYKDYYKLMGVERDASQDEIKRAYRKLARKYHPDVSKEADAELRFKEMGEAYAVLKDPEKRAAYDDLGADWKAGQDFQPPPDWGSGFEFSGSGFEGADAGAYSDFFEELFRHGMGSRGQAEATSGFQVRGEDHHAKVLFDLEDTYSGATHAVKLRAPELGANGRVVTRDRSLNVKIPKGVVEGQKIRLSGQGSPGRGGGTSGDLYLEIAFKPHPFYRPDGKDVHLTLPVTPWEAALGAKIKVPTPAGRVGLMIPAGTSNRKKLRLKGRGIPAGVPGDFYVTTEITLPPANSAADKELYRKMQQDMSYDPREHLQRAGV
jgi:curved DNA-binding protein